MPRKVSLKEFQESGAAAQKAVDGVIASTIQVGAPAASARYEAALPLAQLDESAMNPRKRFDPAGLEELTASIREKGVLTPLLARPDGNGIYEIAAGHRRFRAAKAAGLAAVPVMVCEMSDAELLEVLVIENDQREDVHPLEEAAGYQALMRTAKYDVARVAARIGRSVKYVYDRMKLLQLTKEAQQLFLDGKFSAGHAILLARLKPEDQERALEADGGNAYRISGLFQDDRSLFDPAGDEKPAKKDPYEGLKAVSVREFESWIQERVRFDPDHVDPVLFPETAETLKSARQGKLKLLLITRSYMASDDVRHAGKERVYGENAWKRADGQEKSKTCERSRVGLVASGEGQGEAFLVCINKEKCEVHYGTEIRARQKRQKEIAKGGAPAQKARDSYAEEQKQHDERRRAEEAERLRWKKARPAILEALAGAVKKAPANATGLLAKLVIDGLNSYEARSRDVEKLVPRGKSAEDLIRHAAMIVVASQSSPDGWRGKDELVPMARAFNVDAEKILDEAAPAEVQTPAEPKPAGKRAAKKGGRP